MCYPLLLLLRISFDFTDGKLSRLASSFNGMFLMIIRISASRQLLPSFLHRAGFSQKNGGRLALPPRRPPPRPLLAEPSIWQPCQQAHLVSPSRLPLTPRHPILPGVPRGSGVLLTNYLKAAAAGKAKRSASATARLWAQYILPGMKKPNPLIRREAAP